MPNPPSSVDGYVYTSDSSLSGIDLPLTTDITPPKLPQPLTIHQKDIELSQLLENPSPYPSLLEGLLHENKNFTFSPLDKNCSLFQPEESVMYIFQFKDFALYEKQCSHSDKTNRSSSIKKFRVTQGETLGEGKNGSVEKSIGTLIITQQQEHYNVILKSKKKAVKTMIYTDLAFPYERWVETAKREAVIASKASFPINPPTIDKNYIFLHMPYVKGITLATLIEDQLLSTLSQKILFAAVMALQLSALHEKEIIHGDVKPDNFILSDSHIKPGNIFNAEAKFVDYGCAKIINEDFRTRWYTLFEAPEQNDSNSASIYIDSWMLGLSLYHLFTGSTYGFRLTDDELIQFLKDKIAYRNTLRQAYKTFTLQDPQNELSDSHKKIVEAMVRESANDNPLTRLSPKKIFIAFLHILLELKELTRDDFPEEQACQLSEELLAFQSTLDSRENLPEEIQPSEVLKTSSLTIISDSSSAELTVSQSTPPGSPTLSNWDSHSCFFKPVQAETPAANKSAMDYNADFEPTLLPQLAARNE